MYEHKYNYIIAGGKGIYEVAYHDIIGLPYVVYHNTFISGIKSKLLQILIRLNFNLVLNRLINTPLKGIVYKYMYPAKFTDNKPRCYVFFQSHYAVINTSYISYLRKCYPDAKLVLYMQDVVSSLPYYDMKDYKKKFDLILSYDQGDCEKYGLSFFPTPYSSFDILDLDVKELIDVYFCGAGKTRYKKIFEVYRKCKEEGLKYKFFITGVPQNERIIDEGLIYDQKLSYKENLSYVKSSKCILEVMQENADGFTPRLWEAIMNDKHLLTNNKKARELSYFSDEKIHFFPDDARISSWINSNVEYPNDYKLAKSPKGLLKIIEKKIC